MSYPLHKLGEHIDILSGFAFKTKDFVDTGIPVIKIKNVTPPNVSLTDLSYVPLEIAEQQKKFLLNYDDILIALTGSHINQMQSVVGRVAKVKYYDKSLLNQRVGKIVLTDKDNCDIDYVYYYISQECVKIELANKAGGAANQANISPTDIKNLKIPFPHIETQHRIASILSAYDDLIENNQKQIKLLEEAAQRLYKEWFVDLRFPGYESTPVVDGVPEGWDVKPISSIASLKAGGDKPKEFCETITDKYCIPIYANGISEKGLVGYTDKSAIDTPSVTVSARGTVGVVFLRRKPYMPIVRLISVTPNDNKMDVFFLYLFLSNQSFRSTGAAQQQITVPLLKDKLIICPEKNTRKKFFDIVSPIFDKIDILEMQNENLKESRDRMLPKLMNGELEG